MLARCARCQGTFTTDHFGLQTCPHCGAELMLQDPNAPAGAAGAPPPQPPPPPSAPSAPPAAPPGEAAPPPSGAAPPGGVPPPPAGWGGPPYGGWTPAPPPPPGPEAPSPFADRARAGFFAGFLETWKLVATQPAAFFGRVRIDQTGAAVLFGVIASTIGNVVAALYAHLSGQQAMVALQEFMRNVPEEQARVFRMYLHGLAGSGRSTVAQIVLTPLLALVGIYLGAAIVHLFLLLFRGARRGFDATLTAVAYTAGLNLLLVVPACGGLIALVWGLVSLVIGLGAVQRCGTGRSAAAVLAPAFLACFLACCAAGMGMSAYLKHMEDTSQGTREMNL